MGSSDPNPGHRDDRPRSGISPQALIIASVASAAASFAGARLWGPGTLIGAAAAPVIVALVSEFLRRPVHAVKATAKRVPTPGITRTGNTRSAVATDRARPVVDGTGLVADADVHTRRSRWRWAVITGLLACVIVVGLYTIPDLVTGHSITGNGQPTTFFGGSATAKAKAGPAGGATTTTTVTITKTTTTPRTHPRTTTMPTTTVTSTTTPTTTTSTAATTTPTTTLTTAPTTTTPSPATATTTPAS